MVEPTQDINNQNRGTIIRKILVERKKMSPNLSTSQIAKEWDISQATLSRIENGHDNISFEHFFKVLQSSGNHKEIIKHLEILEPDLFKSYKEKMGHVTDSIAISDDQSRFFSDREFFKIALIVSNENFPVTRDYIKTEFGNNGLKKVDILLAANVLKEEHGMLVTHEKFTMKQFDLKKCLLLLIDECYDESKIGTGENWLSLQTEAVDKEKTMPFIRAELQKTFVKIKEKIYSREFRGKDTIFIGMVTDIVKEHSNNREVI
jgi:transcriptional regulator with XRE-family HTH domain